MRWLLALCKPQMWIAVLQGHPCVCPPGGGTEAASLGPDAATALPSRGDHHRAGKLGQGRLA